MTNNRMNGIVLIQAIIIWLLVMGGAWIVSGYERNLAEQQHRQGILDEMTLKDMLLQDTLKQYEVALDSIKTLLETKKVTQQDFDNQASHVGKDLNGLYGFEFVKFTKAKDENLLGGSARVVFSHPLNNKSPNLVDADFFEDPIQQKALLRSLTTKQAVLSSSISSTNPSLVFIHIPIFQDKSLIPTGWISAPINFNEISQKGNLLAKTRVDFLTEANTKATPINFFGVSLYLQSQVTNQGENQILSYHSQDWVLLLGTICAFLLSILWWMRFSQNQETRFT